MKMGLAVGRRPRRWGRVVVPMANVRQLDAFLLSRQWRDADDGVEIVLWARAQGVAGARARLASGGGDVRATHRHDVRRPARSPSAHDARRSTRRRRLFSLAARARRGATAAARGGRDHPRVRREAVGSVRDGALRHRRAPHRGSRVTSVAASSSSTNPRIKTADASVALSVLALDLETDGFGGPLLSAALATRDTERVFVRGQRPATWSDTGLERRTARVVFVPDERALLTRLFAEIVALDPDVICGWNVIEFDLALLDARCARARHAVRDRTRRGARPRPAGLERERSVDRACARARRPRRHRDAQVRDVRLRTLHARARRARSSSDAARRSRPPPIPSPRSAACTPRTWPRSPTTTSRTAASSSTSSRRPISSASRWSARASPGCRWIGRAARSPRSITSTCRASIAAAWSRTTWAIDVDGRRRARAVTSSTSIPGLYRDVLSFDFRSLYPSIIRTFRIDPLGLLQPGDDPVPGEDGATFAREGAILPGLIDDAPRGARAAMASDERCALARHQDPDELLLRRARDAGLPLLRPAAARRRSRAAGTRSSSAPAPSSRATACR